MFHKNKITNSSRYLYYTHCTYRSPSPSSALDFVSADIDVDKPTEAFHNVAVANST